MRFSVPKLVLLEALSVTGKGISSKSVIPALDNYLLEIKGNRLEITGSNKEVFITKGIDISGGDFEKSISVASARLIDLIKDLPEQPIHFVIEEKQNGPTTAIILKITASQGVYMIPAEEGAVYPKLVTGSTFNFDIAADIFLKGIEKTLFAASGDYLRPALTGVFVRFNHNQVSYTATNTHILSTFNFDVAVDSYKDFIIPARVLSILQATPHDEVINVALDERSAIFKVSDDTIIKSLLIDAKYPDYESIIPINNTNKLVVNRMELIKALKRVINFSNKITNSVKLLITNSSFELTSEDKDFGTEATEQLAHEFSGENITIYLMGKLLMECLNNISSDDVHMYFSTPKRAVLIRDNMTDPSDKTNLMLIMPLVF